MEDSPPRNFTRIFCLDAIHPEPLWALGLSISSGVLARFPDDWRYGGARKFGRAVSRLFPAKRRAVDENLAVINDYAEKRFTTDAVFENFGMTLSDFLSRADVEISVEGRQRAEDARRDGRGVLFLTSHLGNWELGGRILSQWKWPVTAVYQPYKSRAMQRYIQNRRAEGLSYLAVGKGAAVGLGKVLEKKEAVAILADRPFGEDGSPVTLCGKEARLPRGPFVFACRHGAPVIPGFVLQISPGKYRAVVEEPLRPRGRGPEAVNDLLARMARVLEKYLALYGDQWYCFESVWKK